MPPSNDSWAAGSTYERFMGRWSRELAGDFLTWLGAPDGLHWLDVGCGTGALTTAIATQCKPASVVGCDPAEPLLDYARENMPDQRVSFVTAGSGSLPRRRGGYGAITSLLAFNFFPDADAAIQEQRTLASNGGVVSACVWDYAEGMQFLRRFWDVAKEIEPKALELDEGARFPICRPDSLKALFERAGLIDVSCEPLEIRTTFMSFEDYWSPFLGGTGPAPAFVSSLDPEQREDLAQRLRSALAIGGDGAIELTARAWATKAVAS